MANQKLQVAFAAAEAGPFVKTGGLGDVAGSLPKALAEAGAQVTVLVPKYDVIAPEWVERMRYVTHFEVRLAWRREYCGLLELELDGVRFVFVDNERYFKRGRAYGEYDDGERFAFFSMAVAEALRRLPGLSCDVLHCNDWQTALAPVFLRELLNDDPACSRVRAVFSIHNLAFQGRFGHEVLDDVCGLGDVPAAASQLTCDNGDVNYLQGALCYADAITTVSPTYAHEIQTPEFGEGLDGVLRRRSDVLHGVVNGLDVEAYDPARDPHVAVPFSAEDPSGKAACKAALQAELGLEADAGRPFAVMVSRLTRQKGIDLVLYALQRLLDAGVQVAVLGTGDEAYEHALRACADANPGRMAARITFDSALSSRMYAGADLLLMPSLFEPCGLSQLIAMRYGTLPVVRETGGLRDTVQPYNRFTGEGTGFSFASFDGEDFGDAVLRAADVFTRQPDAWRALVGQAMRRDSGWGPSAERYLRLYRSLVGDEPPER